MHEAEHAARVLDAIRARIDCAGGWLPFDDYMELALYAPGLGYYSAGARKLGAGGDFTTAPEISPLFGYCLAGQCVQLLQGLGDGDILELGAGTGRLAFDILSRLAAEEALPARYRILEISADLRERQQTLLARLPQAVAARVEWIDAPPATPWQGVLVANEVLDALPVQCFHWDGEGVQERGVAMDDTGRLIWKKRAANAELTAEVIRLREDARVDWAPGYDSELCPRVAPWIAEVTGSLARGVALFTDYGLPRRDYYHLGRSTGTLRCHYRQSAHEDPFAHPGMEDITAWVDFTRVAEAADAASLDVLGFSTQAALLLGLGIEQELLAIADEAGRIRGASEARQLLMPGEMGETFKAMALGRGWDQPLRGFAIQDLRARL